MDTTAAARLGVKTVEVPIPPSTNHLWRVVRRGGKARVIKSAHYRQWLDVAVLAFRLQLRRVRGPARLEMVVVGGKGWRSNRDLSNTLKAVEDALVAAGILEDDSTKFVVETRQRFIPGGGLAKCFVGVGPAGEFKSEGGP